MILEKQVLMGCPHWQIFVAESTPHRETLGNKLELDTYMSAADAGSNEGWLSLSGASIETPVAAVSRMFMY